ncbi:MAG: hypothetical protein C0426_08515 [Rhodobacter sp.]|nr:hypothetical protein [Rhodobacter sp.]
MLTGQNPLMETAMTPASNLACDAARRSGWPDFGRLRAEASPPVVSPVPPHPRQARLLRLAGRLHRLLAWLTRPLPKTSGGNAVDAATRLEILTRGGFPRQADTQTSARAMTRTNAAKSVRSTAVGTSMVRP